MSLLHEQQLPLPASPLIHPPSMDVATLISSKESNGLSYSTPSSASTAVRPSLSLLPQNMSEPTPTSTMVNGRIYRYVRWPSGNRKASDENLQLGHCSTTGPGSHVWIWRQGQSISAIGTARSQIIGIGRLRCFKAVIADIWRCAGQTAHHTTALYPTRGQRCKYSQGNGHKVGAPSMPQM